MTTGQQQQRLEGMSRIGKTVWHKKSTGHQDMGTVVDDEVCVMVNEYKHMIQKILVGVGFAYRAGYCKFNGIRNQWVQASPYLTESEYGALLAKARAKGWQIFGEVVPCK